MAPLRADSDGAYCESKIGVGSVCGEVQFSTLIARGDIMEAIVSIIIQLVAGAIGGNGIGAAAKNLSLGTTGNTIAGAIGGVGGTWLAGLIPGLADMLSGAGGMDAGALVGQGVAGLVGGGILTAIAAAVKKATAS